MQEVVFHGETWRMPYRFRPFAPDYREFVVAVGLATLVLVASFTTFGIIGTTIAMFASMIWLFFSAHRTGIDLDQSLHMYPNMRRGKSYGIWAIGGWLVLSFLHNILGLVVSENEVLSALRTAAYFTAWVVWLSVARTIFVPNAMRSMLTTSVFELNRYKTKDAKYNGKVVKLG